jgi:hypothetical protein
MHVKITVESLKVCMHIQTVKARGPCTVLFIIVSKLCLYIYRILWGERALLSQRLDISLRKLAFANQSLSLFLEDLLDLLRILLVVTLSILAMMRSVSFRAPSIWAAGAAPPEWK